MSERKVLNKYYPPDFDPSKIPRMKLARNRQYTVRLMAPFNMRCKTCGEYIYKGKKFNARKEDVEGDDYLGIRIYRFYIKCTRCLQEISFKTDPKNTDYEIEAGATRNFMALKLAEEQAQREEDEEKEEEATNPMKLLEKRTQQSKQELELLESLEELRDLNRRQQTIDYDQMLAQYDNEAARQKAMKEQEKLDEAYVKSIFGKKRSTGTVVEEEIVELSDESSRPPQKIFRTSNSSTPNESSYLGSSETVTSDVIELSELKTAVAHHADSCSDSSSWTSSMAIPSLRTTLSSLIKKKTMLGFKKANNSVTNKCSIDVGSISATVTNDSVDKDAATKKTESMKSNTSSDKKTKVSGLSLLCSYSSSSDNESD